jgi:hypothetical protein
MQALRQDQLDMAMALADWMKVNDFIDHDRLIWLIRQINRETHGGRRVYLIHRGESLLETERSVENGLTTFWLGDKTNKYVFMRVHDGASLDGMVSVKMHTTVDRGQVQVVMEVWPVSETDGPLVGTLWMEDCLGMYSGMGIAPTFSESRLTKDLAFTRFIGTLGGFSFGLVRFDEFGVFDSQITLGNITDMAVAVLDQDELKKSLPVVITPIGAAQGEVKAEYFVGGKLPTAKPDSLSAGYFEVLRALYFDGVKIISLEGVKGILTKIGVSEEIQVKFICRMNEMEDEGWFLTVGYENDTYYIPTPELLLVLK